MSPHPRPDRPLGPLPLHVAALLALGLGLTPTAPARADDDGPDAVGPVPATAVLAVDTTASVPAPAVTSVPILESTAVFPSRDRRITVECFAPATPGPHPVVLVLHGSGGMDLGGFLFREQARRLARQGYLALVPHYFDRTGTRIADVGTMVRRFPDWLETLSDLTTFAVTMRGADPGRVGLVGYSLGGFLALSLATLDPRIDAVVEYYGGLPDELADRAGSLPPTLVLHGTADGIVPVAEAHRLLERLEAVGVPHESRLYPGAGHGFLGASHRDSVARAEAFLTRYVAAASPTAPARVAPAARPPGAGGGGRAEVAIGGP